MSKFPAHHILFALNSVSTIAIKAVHCARTTLLMVLSLLLFLFLNPYEAIAQQSGATSHTTRLSVTNQCDFPRKMVRPFLCAGIKKWYSFTYQGIYSFS